MMTPKTKTEQFEKPKAGPMRWLNAFKNTSNGFVYALKNEAAIREEFLLLIVAIPLVFFVSDELHWRIAMLASIQLLIVVEVLNTAIELTLDRISLDMNHMTKLAKDLGSLAVFMAITLALVVWVGAAIDSYF